MNIPTAPTDSLYKFISIFCLGLIITSIVSLVAITNRHNAFVFDVIQQEYALRDDPNPTPNKEAHLESILSLAQISKKDTDCLQQLLIHVAPVATFISILSFGLWYIKEQHLKDELLKLTLKGEGGVSP